MKQTSFISQLSDTTSRFNRKPFIILPAILFALTPLLMVIAASFNNDILFFAYKIQVYYFIVIVVVIPLAIIDTVLVLTGKASSLTIDQKNKTSVISMLRNNTTTILFLICCIGIIASSLWNHNWSVNLLGDIYRSESISTVISYFAVFYLMCTFITAEVDKQKIIFVSSIVSAVVAIYTLFIQITESFIPAHQALDPDCSSVFFHFNHYGYYLAVHIMISAGLCIHSRSKIIRIISGVVMCLNTIVLNLNDTFGAWLGVFFAWILVFVIDCICKRSLKQTLVVFLVFIATTVTSCLTTPNLINSITQFFTDDVHGVVIDENISTGSSRWQMWKIALQCIREKPIFGWGNEGIDDIIYETIGQTRPHNEYLQYTAFYGIPTGICYFAGCFCVFLRALKDRSSLSGMRIVCLTAAFAYLVSAFFGNTMFYTTPFIFILLGLSGNDENESIST